MIEINKEDFMQILTKIYYIIANCCIFYGALLIHPGLLFIVLGIAVYVILTNFKEVLAITVVMPIITNKLQPEDLSSQLDGVLNDIVGGMNKKDLDHDDPDPK